MTPLGAPSETSSGAGEALQRIYDKCQRALINASHDSAYDLALAVGQMAASAIDAARALPREPGLRITEENHGRLTAAVREADLAFEGVGGGTKHYVRECLLPALDKAGLIVTLAAEAAPTREGGA